MKSTHKVSKIQVSKIPVLGLVILLTIVFSMAACGGGGGDGDPNDPNKPNNSALSGNITISPTDNVTTGTELTAAYSGSEKVIYQWKKGDTNVGENYIKYTPSGEGSYTVTVSAAGYQSKTSSAVVVVPREFTSISEFETWIKAQRNYPDDPYSVKLNISNLGGSSDTNGSLGSLLKGTKWVNLDLSGSTFTSIESGAFQKCSSLFSVTIPNGVTSLEGSFINGIGAFTDCYNLKSVTIPNSVTKIGDYSFDSCIDLTSVTIPANVTSIGQNAFSSCTSLTSVTFETGSNISNFENNAFPGGNTGYQGNELRTAYNATAGGAGTYTRAANGSTWTKQQ